MSEGRAVFQGRVLARSGATNAVLLVRPDKTVALEGEALGSLHEGDLARVWGAHDGADGPVHVTRVELVYCPRRSPFGPDAETRGLALDGRYARLVLRQRVLDAVRGHFRSEGFLEVDTPLVVPSPGLDVQLHAFEVRGSGGEHSAHDPSSRAGYLSTSPEYQMKRLLAGGVGGCFQFARCFRSDEAGRRHEPEFTMLEWYRAWADFEALLGDTERVVRAAATCANEPLVLVHEGARVPTEWAFERLTVREAFARYAPDEGDPVELCARDEDRYFRTLVERIEPKLGFDRPTFLTHYPASQASLARLAPEDPTVALRAELYVAGVELCNGFEELTDVDEQRSRLARDQDERRARGLPVYPIDERFLSALEEGMPPSAGNALGVDRLVALVAGRDSIADVMAFSRART